MRGIEYYINLCEREKEKIGLVHTAAEIYQQPSMWLDTYSRVVNHQELQKWGDCAGPLRERNHVVLSGAGTSYYIGVCLQPLWREALKRPVEAWPTTRIVSEPETVFSKEYPTLHVTFARSGNNPETMGAVELADIIHSDSYHLGITCNAESYLASLDSRQNNATSITLNRNVLDRGLAMTSSFTSLIVAGQAVASLAAGLDGSPIVESMATLAKGVLSRSAEYMKIIADGDFERVYIMGDSSLYGVALEGVLKFEEFSDGQIMGLAESFLGARHGNANVINERTLIVSLLSSDEYVRTYQLEVVKEIKERRPDSSSLVVSLHALDDLEGIADHVIVLDETNSYFIPDSWRAPLDMVILQCMALQSSIKLGLCPDNPFRHRATARAIEGLKLRNYRMKGGEAQG